MYVCYLSFSEMCEHIRGTLDYIEITYPEAAWTAVAYMGPIFKPVFWGSGGGGSSASRSRLG